MSSTEGYPPPPQQYSPQQYAAPQYSTGRTRRVIKRIDVFSAAKVFAVATALITAVFGLVFVLLAICGALSAIASLGNNNGNGAGGFGAIALLFVYVVFVVMNGVIGFITGALYAYIYNMASQWIGGLVVEVE